MIKKIIENKELPKDEIDESLESKTQIVFTVSVLVLFVYSPFIFDFNTYLHLFQWIITVFYLATVSIIVYGKFNNRKLKSFPTSLDKNKSIKILLKVAEEENFKLIFNEDNYFEFYLNFIATMKQYKMTVIVLDNKIYYNLRHINPNSFSNLMGGVMILRIDMVNQIKTKINAIKD